MNQAVKDTRITSYQAGTSKGSVLANVETEACSRAVPKVSVLASVEAAAQTPVNLSLGLYTPSPDHSASPPSWSRKEQ